MRKKNLICESKKYQMAKVYFAKFSHSLHSRKFILRIFLDFPICESLSKEFRAFFGSQKFFSGKFLQSK